MRGRKVYSDPLPIEDGWSDEDVERLMNKMIEAVFDGASLSLSVDSVKENFLNHAIESLYWTKGS
jgi:hypothetical protein